MGIEEGRKKLNAGSSLSAEERELFFLAESFQFAVLKPAEHYVEYFGIPKKEGLQYAAQAIADKVKAL